MSPQRPVVSSPVRRVTQSPQKPRPTSHVRQSASSGACFLSLCVCQKPKPLGFLRFIHRTKLELPTSFTPNILHRNSFVYPPPPSALRASYPVAKSQVMPQMPPVPKQSARPIRFDYLFNFISLFFESFSHVWTMIFYVIWYLKSLFGSFSHVCTIISHAVIWYLPHIHLWWPTSKPSCYLVTRMSVTWLYQYCIWYGQPVTRLFLPT